LRITAAMRDKGDMLPVRAPHRGAIVACPCAKAFGGSITAAHPDGAAVFVGNSINTDPHIGEGIATRRPCHVFDVFEAGDIGNTPRRSCHMGNPFVIASWCVLYREVP